MVAKRPRRGNPSDGAAPASPPPEGSTFAVQLAPQGDERAEPVLVSQEGDQRAGWRQLLEEYGDAEWVAPVQADSSGAISIPTGEVTVRFHEAPTDDAAEAFARRHGAQVTRRAEYQPKQVVLVPEDRRGTFLPELCAQLESESDVERAWPNTVSRYRRA